MWVNHTGGLQAGREGLCLGCTSRENLRRLAKKPSLRGGKISARRRQQAGTWLMRLKRTCRQVGGPWKRNALPKERGKEKSINYEARSEKKKTTMKMIYEEHSYETEQKSIKKPGLYL